MTYLNQNAYEQAQPTAQSSHSTTRQVRYMLSRAFYEGLHWDSDPAPGERRLTLNYCRVFVNKAASYLLGKPVIYNSDDPLVEQYLAEVADFNELGAVDLDTAITAGQLGDGAWTARYDKDAELVRVTQVDPMTINCGWRADDLRSLTWVQQRYFVTFAELTMKQQAKLSAGDHAIYTNPDQTLKAVETWTPATWSLKVNDVTIDGGPNPYGLIPYVVFPNLRLPAEFWGESDLADIIGLNKELNRRISVFSQVLELTGSPTVVVEGADADETAGLSVGPGKLWPLPKETRAYILDLLAGGAADAQLKFLDSIYRALHDISEMPRTSFGDTRGQTATSGVALEVELQPLLHKLSRKRAIWTSALNQRAKIILAIANTNGRKLPPAQVRSIWPAVLPQDRAALVTQEVALVGAGIHPPTKAGELLEEPNPDKLFEKVIEEGTRLRDALQVSTQTPDPRAKKKEPVVKEGASI